MKLLNNKLVIRIFQILLSLGALIYVVGRLKEFNNWEAFYYHIIDNRIRFLVLLGVLLILSGLNLVLESLKWQQLISAAVYQSFKRSCFQVLKGLQFGMITPARSGEPVARALLIPRGLRMKAFLLSSTGSVIQNMILAGGGIIGVTFLQAHMNDLNIPVTLQKSLLYYSVIFVFVVLALIGLGSALMVIYRGKSLMARMYGYFVIIRRLGGKRFFRVLLYTLTRYLVYCTQLWLLLIFFGISHQVIDIWLIPLYFATLTFIPSVAIADLGIRSSVALFIFGFISGNSAGIILSVFLLWCFNLALPALLVVFVKPSFLNRD